MKSKYLKILGVPIDDSATAYHRVIQPLQALKERGYPVQFLDEPSKQAEQYQWADVLYVQCLYAPGAFAFYADQKKIGKKIIVDFDDDYFNIPANSPEQTEVIDAQTGEVHRFPPEMRIVWVKMFLGLVDVLVVTTPALKELYEPFTKKIEVIPNCVIPEMQRDVPKGKRYKTRILWSGSASHLPDLELLREPLSKLVETHGDQVELHFQGPLPFSEIFPELSIQVHPPVPFSDYLNAAQAIDADIALLPISSNPFNQGKSNLKFLQMTLLEAACVASDFGPYRETISHNVSGLLAETPEDWYQSLVRLVENPEQRCSLISEARKLCDLDYSLDCNIAKWENLIRRL